MALLPTELMKSNKSKLRLTKAGPTLSDVLIVLSYIMFLST